MFHSLSLSVCLSLSLSLMQTHKLTGYKLLHFNPYFVKFVLSDYSRIVVNKHTSISVTQHVSADFLINPLKGLIPRFSTVFIYSRELMMFSYHLW